MDGRNRMFTHALSESSSKPYGKNGLARRDTKNKLYIESVPLKTVVSDIEEFVMPLVRGVAMEGHWNRSWRAGGPWQD
jgi:hypothetical protein